MKKSDFRIFKPGTVEYVVAHTKWRRQRGKKPSAQLFGVDNSGKGLRIAVKLSALRAAEALLPANALRIAHATRLANNEVVERRLSKSDFDFDFDFSTFNQWDKSVGVEQFKKLVNEAANIADGILGELFVKTVEQLDYPKNVKKMVLLFLVGEKEAELI